MNPDPDRQTPLPKRLRYQPMGAAYQGAMESVFAIAVAMAAGWWADRHWDTSPIWLLVGATIGFGAFVLRLYRLGAAVNASAAEETSSQSPDGDDRESVKNGSVENASGSADSDPGQ